MSWRREHFYMGFVCGLIAGLLIGLIAQRAHASEMAIGDSIAVGLRLPGSAEIGIGPKEVVHRIGMTPLNRLHGHVVVLSTGMSNDPEAWRYVPIQLDMLKAAGAHVILLGVGSVTPKSVEINKWLKFEAEIHSFPFVAGWVDVHPANYCALIENIRLVECQVYKICDA